MGEQPGVSRRELYYRCWPVFIKMWGNSALLLPQGYSSTGRKGRSRFPCFRVGGAWLRLRGGEEIIPVVGFADLAFYNKNDFTTHSDTPPHSDRC